MVFRQACRGMAAGVDLLELEDGDLGVDGGGVEFGAAEQLSNAADSSAPRTTRPPRHTRGDLKGEVCAHRDIQFHSSLDHIAITASLSERDRNARRQC